ncbi:LPS export ABC transporter periplasmic protein LptC [Candidatus Pacearchaeota archaeon]|nr:MAG: LPS export ABC transporter periplasmic protein LptC [Candidatus Pacearchaeota archaeon]
MARNLKFLFNLLILIFGLFFLFSLSAKGDPLEIIAYNLKYTLFKNNKLSWHLKAKKFVQKGKNYFEAESLFIFNPLKDVKIYGKRGIYNKMQNKFIIRGKVILKTSNKGEIYTEELIFYADRNLIVSNREVTVKKKDCIIKGKGFVYDLNTENFKLKEKAWARFKL